MIDRVEIIAIKTSYPRSRFVDSCSAVIILTKRLIPET
jgi:hypothetical protein